MNGTRDELLDELTGYAHTLLALAEAETTPASTVDLLQTSSVLLARAHDMERECFEEEQRYVRSAATVRLFRTGPLAAFIKQAEVLRDLASRRLTWHRLEHDMREGDH